MTFQFPEKAIRETIAAIRDIDERADNRSWRWADMGANRRAQVVLELIDNLTELQVWELLTDAGMNRAKALARGEREVIDCMAVELTEWFETVIEPRINSRVAA